MKKEPFKVALSVDGLELSNEVLDNHLAIVEVYVCHDGNNAHNLPIKLETIKDAQETLKNKPLVAGFNGYDFEGHEIDEVLIGYFPESSNMRYVKKNGKTYLVAEAILPKLYAKWAYDIFQRDRNKSVSMEIEVLDFEELYPEDPNNDMTEIKKFIFNAVTVLGEEHMPACEGANATMIKFSKEKAEKVYDKYVTSQKIKNKYFEDNIPTESDDTTYMEKNIKINNKKESAIDSDSWSNPGKSLYEPLLEASNTKSLVNEAYLIVADGYEDAPSEHLKYPHHNVKGSELVLNVKGVIAAFQRASQEGIVSGKVRAHLLRHYRELGLSTENFEINEEGGESMPEDKEMEVASEEMETKTTREEVEKDNAEEELKKQKEDEKSDRDDAEEEAKEKEEDERSEIDDYREEEKGEEMEADSEEENPEKELDERDSKITELEKKNQMLEEEVCMLKEKLCKYEEDDKTRIVESTLSEVMDLMSQDEIAELREEAKEYSLEEMSAFSNKVKAFAFEKISEAKKEDKASYTKMAITENAKKKANGLW